MTDEFKSHIKKVFEMMLDGICSGYYSVDYIWEDVADPTDTADTVCPVSITVNATYTYVSLYVRPRMFEYFTEGNWRILAKSLLHEACHVLIEPLWRAQRPFLSEVSEPGYHQIMEHTVELIAKSLWSFMPDTMACEPIKTLRARRLKRRAAAA